jgi:predicted phage tail protein
MTSDRNSIIGAGGGGCFTYDTLVRTPDGDVSIATIKAGDTVIAFDDTGALHEASVLAIHVHENHEVFRYNLWGSRYIDATPNHWVLNQFNTFVEISTLSLDDCFVDVNNHLRPYKGCAKLPNTSVYNLTVDKYHTFIANGVRVHNAGLGADTVVGSGGGDGKGRGGGGGTRVPVTAPDSLNSVQYAHVLDLISEGEIEGLVDGLKSVYINNTPLQNNDNSYNFEDVELFTQNGTQDQGWVPLGSGGVENEVNVGVTVRQAIPITRSITNSEVDAVRVKIAIPALQSIDNTNGDTYGTSVTLRISVQYSGTGFVDAVVDTISGRTSDRYDKQYVVALNSRTPGVVVDVRVTRVTADSGSQLLSNEFAWTSYTEITYIRLAYPNSALIGLRVNAQQFNSVPQRSYLIKGIKVQIPSGVTVDSTTGRIIYPTNFVWNGTFSSAVWTSCPSWILWDLLTDGRYGFGDHIAPGQLDKWAFFAASKYANELVADGFGGQEARFSCNAVIQTSDDAYKLINDLLSVMRCQGFWASGALTIAQDRPADPVYLFSPANVSKEGFSYSGSSLKARPNVAVISYFDNDLRDIGYEAVEDIASVDKYGVVRADITAFACTSRGQANRIGRWLLYTEQNETEVVSFKCGVEAGYQVRPGQLVRIADPLRMGSRRAGRIAAATTSQVTVDNAAETDLSGSLIQAVLHVILPTGVVESRGISSIAGGIIYVSTPFSVAPNVNSVWIIENPTVAPSTWRVVSVKEEDATTYVVSALAYSAAKYGYVEAGEKLAPRSLTNLNPLPPAPTDVRGIEADVDINGVIVKKVVFTWVPPQGIAQFRVRYRYESDNFTTLVVQGTTFEIVGALTGTYYIQVNGITASGEVTLASLGQYQVGPYVDTGYWASDYTAS